MLQQSPAVDALPANTALPASQIISILQQRPEAVIELKTLLAERAQQQQQGSQVQPDDISDDTLYSQIESNPELRVNVTTFLRARGYVSDDDLQSAALARNGDDLTRGTSLEAGSISQSDPGIVPEAINGQTGRNSSGMSSNTLRGSANYGPLRNREAPVNTSTDEPKVLHEPAPYDLRSMRDLYAQIPDQTTPLKRFGSEVFLNRAAGVGSSSSNVPMDIPLGPDYVLNAGDVLSMNLWGGVTQTVSRSIGRDGQILLPEAGSLQVAGLTLAHAQDLIESAMKRQYRNVQVAVTVARLHSVRVYVVGDVQRPGGYDLSSLATPVSALYAAGGPTSAGSLRTARHMRGDKLIEDVDLYDFLLHGVRNGSARFESGDTLLVPPAGPQVAVDGAVKRPAIYELRSGELKSGESKTGASTLLAVVDDAGGVTVAASLSHITIERIDANHQRETVTLNAASTNPTDKAALASFHVQDGDRIRIAPILPYSERAVYLEGHVVRPGRLPFTEGMRLSDVLRSYQDMLPEPAAHGEIVRLVPPDLHAETLDFDVPDVLIGNANLPLHPFDTVRVFGRYQVDAPRVTIHGEVLRPGAYPLSRGMTAAQLVRMAGGFKRDALVDSADLTSYNVDAGNKVSGNLASVRIGAAVNGNDSTADIGLKPGDVLTIHQITGWNDIGQSITIAGQVRFPGNYGFQEGERLSSVLRRAGGFRDTAYPAGAVLTREQVRELEEKSRDELIRQIETNAAAARLSPNISASANSGEQIQLIKAQQEEVLGRLKSQPATGRLVVHISADIDSWANTPADIELRRGDVLTVPKRPGFVLVTGQVYNATAITFDPGKSASWYLRHAGGTNSTANRKEIFIIRANGSVIGRHSGGFFDADVLATRMEPGDVVVVPQKIIGSSLFWRNLLTTAQLASSIAITAAVASL
jgi:protein involved in polysaccharide export with SLBB domain